MYRLLSASITIYSLHSFYLCLHVIYSPHLLSTSHKSTHPCFSPLYAQPAAQRMVKRWSSSTRNSRRVWFPGRFSYGVLESSDVMLHQENRLVFCKTIIRVINILFVTCELCITLILSVCVVT
jgi:hypothetical protein